jgi:pyruvate-ferredoxin/flavodoxin oxidoreductase
VIAYSHCIAHGIDMRKGLEQQKLAVQSGMWTLYRYNPDLIEQGKNPLIIDSKAPSISADKYTAGEGRFQMLIHSDPARAESLMAQASAENKEHYIALEKLAKTSE